LVNVTTPTAPNAVLPTKFAVAEKHMVDFSPARGLHRSRQNATFSLIECAQMQAGSTPGCPMGHTRRLCMPFANPGFRPYKLTGRAPRS
jgi:hypothetical protein